MDFTEPLKRSTSESSKFVFEKACGRSRNWLLPTMFTCAFGVVLSVFSTYSTYMKPKTDKADYVYLVFHPGMGLVCALVLRLLLHAFYIGDDCHDRGIDHLLREADNAWTEHQNLIQKEKSLRRPEDPPGSPVEFGEAQSKWRRVSRDMWWIGSLLTIPINPLLIYIAWHTKDPIDPLIKEYGDYGGEPWFPWAYRIALLVLVWSGTPIWLILNVAFLKIDQIIDYIEKLMIIGDWELVYKQSARLQELINYSFRLKSGVSLAMMWFEVGIALPFLIYILGLAVFLFDEFSPGPTTHLLNISSRNVFVWAILLVGAGLAISSLYVVSKISSRLDKLGRHAWISMSKNTALEPTPTNLNIEMSCTPHWTALETKPTNPNIEMSCTLQWHQKVVALFSDYPLGIYTCGVRQDSKLVMLLSKTLIGYVPVAYGALKVFIANSGQ